MVAHRSSRSIIVTHSHRQCASLALEATVQDVERLDSMAHYRFKRLDSIVLRDTTYSTAVYNILCTVHTVEYIRLRTQQFETRLLRSIIFCIETLYIYWFLFFFVLVSARTLYKRLTIQRRLAWSLDKNDTHNRREANLFFGVVRMLCCFWICKDAYCYSVQALTMVLTFVENGKRKNSLELRGQGFSSILLVLFFQRWCR